MAEKPRLFKRETEQHEQRVKAARLALFRLWLAECKEIHDHG